MSKYGTPVYRAHTVHVVRYMKDGESRTCVGNFSFKFLKGRIEKLHGKEAANTAVSWGWQIPPIDYRG